MAIVTGPSTPSSGSVNQDPGPPSSEPASTPAAEAQEAAPSAPAQEATVPAYEQNAQGEFVYNPDNTAGIANVSDAPVNTEGSKYSAPSGDGGGQQSQAVPSGNGGGQVVIGTSPTTGEVLVKDTGTGEMSWQPGTPEQVESATKGIQEAGEYGTPEYEEYQVPETPGVKTTEGATPAPGTAPSTTWKPDFTQPDPWAGMPPEYAEKVAESFVPTKEHPTPPGFDQSETMKQVWEAKQAEAAAPTIVGASPTTGQVIVKDPQTGEMYWKPGTEEQIKQVTESIEKGETPTIKYTPPEGVTPDKPVAGSMVDSPFEDFQTKWEDKIAQPPEPTIPTDQIPTEPDEPGGQVATLPDGTKVYIQGSTMREKLGFETPEQYGEAQRSGQTYGPLMQGPTFTGTQEEYQQYVEELKTLQSAPVEVSDFKGETVTVPADQLSEFYQAKGQEHVDLGVKLGIYQEGSKYTEVDGQPSIIPGWAAQQQERALEQLKTTDPELYDLYKKDPDAYQREVEKRQQAYEEWMSQFTEQELAEIQSGQYKVYVPDPTDPENVNKGQWIPSTKEAYDQQQKAIDMGIGPHALGEIASGKYMVPDAQGNMIPTTKDFFETYQQAQEAKQEIQQFAQTKGVSPSDFVSLYNAGISVDTLREAYPGNDEYFDGIERTLAALKDYTKAEPTPGTFLLAPGSPRPTTYVPDVVAALAAGAVTTEQLKELGYDPSFVDNTHQYVGQLSELVNKFNEGVQPRGSGLSRGLGITGSEAIDLGTAIREAGFDIEGGSAVVTWRNMSDEEKYQVAEVLAGYPKLGSPLVSTVRSLQSITTDEDLPTVAKVALEVLTAPVTAILNPFTKEMTVGELQNKLEPYAIKDETSGTVTGYDLSTYMAENPYDAPLLVRGGFKPEAVEKAQEAGSEIVSQPQGATPLDWAVAGVMAASVALPVLKGASGFVGRGIVGTAQAYGAAGAPITRAGMVALRAAETVYVGASIGEKVIKWGLPVGMTALDVMNWDDWTPEQRIVAGAFTGLTYIPVLGTLWRAGRGAVANIRTQTTEGGIPPRALTTGYQDVYAVRTPPDFFEGVPTSTRSQLRTIAYDAKTSTPQRLEQVAGLLEPQSTAPAFRQTTAMVLDMAGYRVPSQYHAGAVNAFASVQGMTPVAAASLTAFLANHPEVYVKGSTAMAAQGMNVIPHDIDAHIFTGGKAEAEAIKAQIQEIVGSGVEIDISYPGKFPPLPYGMESYVPEPITIDGVKFQTVGEQALRLAHTVISPGVGESRGLMGPTVETLPPKDFPVGQVGTYVARTKDVAKLQLLTQTVIDQLKAAGQTAKAAELQGYLDTFKGYQTRLADGSIKPLTPEEAYNAQQAALELVKEVQYQTLVEGRDVSIIDPESKTVITKIVSPAGEVMPGTVYFATRDYRPDVAALESGGKWAPTERYVFFSPEAAFDFLIDRTTGELGPYAGIIAVRTVPATDIGPGGIISGPFRYENMTVDPFTGREEPVIYNELISDAEFYAVDPNVRAMSNKSITKGVTGESFTYYPRTGKEIPIIWTATETARAQGLGAPTPSQVTVLRRMAIEQSLADLLHPHLSRITTEPVPAHLRADLVEFYQNTYKWKKATPEQLAQHVEEVVQATQDKAVANLESKGTALTEESITNEMNRLAREGLIEKVNQISKGMGIEPPKDIDTFIDGLSKTDTPTVQEIRKMLESLGKDASNIGSRAQSAYDDSIRTVLADAATKGPGVTTDTVQKLYYLNIGKLSAKLATAAVTTSILTATAPAIAGTLVPPTKSAPGELTPDMPATTTEPVLTSPEQVEVIETPTGLFEVDSEPVITPPPTEGIEIETPEITPPTAPITPPPPTGETPIPPPETPPPPDTPPPPPSKPTRVVLPGGEVKAVETVSIPPGSIAWRQGTVFGKEQIKYIPPPYDVQKPISLIGKQPEGWRELGRTPEETIQVIGESEAEVPKVISVDLGVVDAFIYDGARIEFKGGGEETNVGTRIDEPTMGMSVPAEQPTPLKYGTTFQEAVAYVPHSEAQREFIEDRIAEQMSKMTTDEIATEIKAAGLSEERQEELLTHVPDKQRQVVREKMKPKYFTRVGKGFQFAETSRRPVTPTPKGKGKGLAEKLADEEANELFTEDEIREMRAQGLSKLRPGARNGKARGQKAPTAEQLAAEIFSNKGLEDL